MKNISKTALLLLFFFPSFSFIRTEPVNNVYNEVPLLHQRVEQLLRNKVSDFFIFSHGRPGALLLMGEWKDAEQIAAWLKTRINFQIKAVRIFGCEFGKGEKGRAAVDYLQRALNVMVSASDNITGKDGDWKLETGTPYIAHGLEDYVFNLQCGGVAGGTNPGDDFDGDSICNDVDIDDDNDGVPDNTERSSRTVPLYQSFWEVKVYDYPSEDAFVLHSSGNFGPLTQVASGTMMGASNSLDLNWINASARSNVLPSLNQSGGNVTGSNPSTNNYAVYFVHTFTNNDAGWYTIQQGTLYDGKHIYKTKKNSTDSTVFESTDWTVSNTTVNIYFEPGSKLNFFVWENGNNNARAVINIRPSAGQQFYADVDTDGDGFSDYQDLDSDGDGCSDAYEAGATTDTANNYRFTGAVGTNGLVNSLETATDSGVINYTSAYHLYALYKLLNRCADTDEDSIADVFDLDDDNDGVLDAVESPGCFYTAAEANSITKIRSQFASPDDDQTDGDIQLLHDADAATKSFNFNDYTTAQNPTGSNLFTIAYSTPVQLATLVVSDNISSTANANAVVTGSNDGVTWSAALSPATVITTTPVTFTIGTNQAYKYYRIETGSVAGALATGNTIGEITSTLASGYNPSAHPKSTCTVDTDADNIFNQTDLDSDGDSCSDAVEAGVAKSSGSPTMEPGVLKNKDSEVKVSNAVVRGPYGGNGFANSVETSSESGVYNSTYTYSKATDGAPVSDCAARSQILPVRMLGFTAKATNKTVLLNWITTNEVNNQYFDIERSANGNSWSAIGRVEGKNRPGVHKYEFADMNALNGISYYRLKQKDFDGKYVYSEVRTINTGIENRLTLHPNPAQNYIIISMKDLNGKDISVYDVSGKNVTPLLLIKQNRSVEFFINIEVLTNGLYILKAKGKIISFVKN